MIHFSVNDVPVTESEDKGPIYTMQLSPEAVTSSAQGGVPGYHLPAAQWRRPRSALAHPVSQRDAGADPAAATLYAAHGSTAHPDEDAISRVSPLARMEIEQQMEAVAPEVELTMESECPECGREYAVPFDLQQFLLQRAAYQARPALS